MKNLELKKGYRLEKFDKKFAVMNGFFVLFMPIFVPYQRLWKRVAAEHKNADWEFGMIEKSVGFGFGWVGVSIPKTESSEMKTKELSGEFYTYEYTGTYKKLGDVWKKVMTDYPGAKAYYSSYLNNPNNTPEDELRTKLLVQM